METHYHVFNVTRSVSGIKSVFFPLVSKPQPYPAMARAGMLGMRVAFFLSRYQVSAVGNSGTNGYSALDSMCNDKEAT